MLVELNVFNEPDKHVPVYWPLLLQLQQKLIQLQQVLQLEKIKKNLAFFSFYCPNLRTHELQVWTV